MKTASAIVDLTAARDRQWFEAHRGIDRYLRPFVPGELPATLPTGFDAVLVTRIATDMRAREPLSFLPGFMPADVAAQLGVELWCSNCSGGGR